MLCHVTRMLVTLLLKAVTWNGGALGTKNICESGRKKKTNKQINSCSVKYTVSSPVRQTSWKCWPCAQQICVIDYAWSQDGLILPETKMRSIKRQKKGGEFPATLNEQAWWMKDIITQTKRKLLLAGPTRKISGGQDGQVANQNTGFT